MIIKLTIPTPPSFVHLSLFEEVRADLFAADIHLDKLSVDSFDDDKATVFAVVRPGDDLADLTQDEVEELAQSVLA